MDRRQPTLLEEKLIRLWLYAPTIILLFIGMALIATQPRLQAPLSYCFVLFPSVSILTLFRWLERRHQISIPSLQVRITFSGFIIIYLVVLTILNIGAGRRDWLLDLIGYSTMALLVMPIVFVLRSPKAHVPEVTDTP